VYLFTNNRVGGKRRAAAGFFLSGVMKTGRQHLLFSVVYGECKTDAGMECFNNIPWGNLKQGS